MRKDDDHYLLSRNRIAFLLLFFLVFLSYSDTFQSSWHFDDYHNITDNPRLKIRDLRPGSLVQTFYGAFDGGLYEGIRVYRPIPALTFALNWYFGKDDVFGYHLVNILIHLGAAFFLFLTILNMFRSTNLNKRYQGDGCFIALLAAALWAVNPVQTQAVTYIVQRMASMAAFFYLLGIYLYVKGRTNDRRSGQIVFYVGCFFSFILAMGSKENAATLPMALLLLEFTFFQDFSLRRTKRAFFFIGGLISMSAAIAGIWFFMLGDPLAFLNGFDARPFSCYERLLTQARIVLFYLSQLFYPVPTRLSMAHDILISTSLLNPWTTLPSLLMIIFLIAFGISQIVKRPIISFAILFFFINHLIESSIMPLELIFEHRNYMPSLFLFFPVAVGLNWLLNHYRLKSGAMFGILCTFVGLLITGLVMGTYVRNKAWATEKTLWEDAMRKAPGNARPYHNLAKYYYESIGDFDHALILYRSALGGQIMKHSDRAFTLNNIGGILYRKSDYDSAVAFFTSALKYHSRYKSAHFNLALSYLQTEDLDGALKEADWLISWDKEKKEHYEIRGFVLLKQKRFHEALDSFNKALSLDPKSKGTLTNIGITLSLMNEHRSAETYLLEAEKLSPADEYVIFWLLQNGLTADLPDSERYIDKLIGLFNPEHLKKSLREIAADPFRIPVSSHIIVPRIEKRANRSFGQF